eukprot:gnl/MRDRNA2_/MRDRNA2_129060_c0_seq1.p1 gnl/MRDRNA2_/MRDRNA2_129060_c0~~gnl/MRDRNA2_/MRDRNA2_129060_c0_seq1.p1  ORF type:complete len:180 (-),score=39.71 gnl/MRDRNA2_/MRDRNA2_129060_c0_seq1:86-625(-)
MKQRQVFFVCFALLPAASQSIAGPPLHSMNLMLDDHSKGKLCLQGGLFDEVPRLESCNSSMYTQLFNASVGLCLTATNFIDRCLELPGGQVSPDNFLALYKRRDQTDPEVVNQKFSINKGRIFFEGSSKTLCVEAGQLMPDAVLIVTDCTDSRMQKWNPLPASGLPLNAKSQKDPELVV